MGELFRFYRTGLLACLVTFPFTETLQADHPISFPWTTRANSEIRPGGQGAVYQALPQPRSGLKGHADHNQQKYLSPGSFRTLPTKVHYAYGWFGSNPHPIWGRHFDFQNNNTQWTRR